MGSSKFLILILFFLLLNIQPSSPSSIGLRLVETLRRKLLQATSTFTTLTPDNTHLKLCETDVCDTRRPDGPSSQGLCDRWARGGSCPEEQIFHVQGDPGTNDKAEMFFNLRSPWNVACDKGKCTPSLGAIYNVFVAEGCIPEQDYISEMQDTSDRVSKQVKIYLRRKAEFYITIQRRPGMDFGPVSNCSFGMTVGSIEAQSDTAKCFDFRRINRGEAASANVPNCREVMPQYQSFQQPDTSAQATFVVALIGLGILVLALLVLVGVLLRRWSRRKLKKKEEANMDFGGVQPGVSNSLALAAAVQPLETTGTVVVNVLAPEPREEDEPRRKQHAPGVRTKQDRERLERRMMQIEDGGDDDEVDEDELGANAGVLEGRGGSAALQFKQGRGGSKLVMGGGSIAKGAASRASIRPGSSSSAGSGSSGSPADELYRNRVTSRLMPGSPGGSRVPTPPERGQGPRGAAPRRAPGSRGSSVAGEDVDFSIRHRPGTGGTDGSTAEWEDGTGIRIDDILAQARGAAAVAAGGKVTPDRSRAWKPGERSPAPSSGSAGRSGSIAGSSSGSGEGSRRDLTAGPAVRQPAPPAPAGLSGAAGRPTRPPVMAPLMAARLGIKPQQAIGGRSMAPLGSKPASSPGKTEVTPSVATRTVMLQSFAPQRQTADLPVAGQLGVPLPPARGGSSIPPARAGPANGSGTAAAQRPGVLPGPPQNAPNAWRTPRGTPHDGAQRPSLYPAIGLQGSRPPMGGGAGANGRDGRGMARLGGRRGTEHVLEEDD